MSRASGQLAEGVVTFAVGAALKLYAADVDIPVVEPAKVGVVLMVLGGALFLMGAVGLGRRGRAD
ncbi:DUF5708 family protein [Streptomyces luteireticuli]|uniref:DUF5708 family protein n=1 Tax=Streptomyces luteireticuli TaxID=173858 RepID=UPI003558A1EA